MIRQALFQVVTVITALAGVACRDEPPLSVADVVGTHSLTRFGGRAVPYIDVVNGDIFGVDGGTIVITSDGRFTLRHTTRFGATVHQQECTLVVIQGAVTPADRILTLESTGFGQATASCIGGQPVVAVAPSTSQGSWSLWTVEAGETREIHMNRLGTAAIYRKTP